MSKQKNPFDGQTEILVAGWLVPPPPALRTPNGAEGDRIDESAELYHAKVHIQS